MSLQSSSIFPSIFDRLTWLILWLIKNVDVDQEFESFTPRMISFVTYFKSLGIQKHFALNSGSQRRSSRRVSWIGEELGRRDHDLVLTHVCRRRGRGQWCCMKRSRNFQIPKVSWSSTTCPWRQLQGIGHELFDERTDDILGCVGRFWAIQHDCEMGISGHLHSLALSKGSKFIDTFLFVLIQWC